MMFAPLMVRRDLAPRSTTDVWCQLEASRVGAVTSDCRRPAAEPRIPNPQKTPAMNEDLLVARLVPTQVRRTAFLWLNLAMLALLSTHGMAAEEGKSEGAPVAASALASGNTATASDIQPAQARSSGSSRARRTPPVSPYPETSRSEAAEHWEREGIIVEPLPAERPGLHRKTTPLPPAKAATEHQCDLDPLAEVQGRGLIDHILRSPATCLTSLLETQPPSLRSAAFRMANMLAVAEEAKILGAGYRGENTEDIRRLILYLRAGHYNRFYAELALDWDDDGDDRRRVDDASMEAADALFQNERFLALDGDAHGTVATEAFNLTHHLDISRYIAVYRDWLSRLSPERLQSDEMATATNRIFAALFRGHYEFYLGSVWKRSFVAAIASDFDLVHLLTATALAPGYDRGRLYIQENAGRELAHMLQHEGLPIYTSVVTGLRSILEHYDVLGEGVSIHLITARVIDDLEKCHVFDTCDLRERVEAAVLRHTYRCPQVPVTIRAQALPEVGLAAACEQLLPVNRRFHRLLGTRNDDPVASDLNDQLHVIVFEDSENYRTYSRFLFGNPTNNGGIYREGNPSDSDNIPLVFVYEAFWARDPSRDFYPVLSLDHEYVHYLDGRFVKRGAPWDYGSQIVGWAEGLAEYVSLWLGSPLSGNGHYIRDLIRETRRPPNLTRILTVTYRDSVELVYGWGHLAVRFLFEQHPTEVQEIVRMLRAGRYDDWRRYIGSLAKYEREFARWLDVVKDLWLVEVVFREPVSTQEGQTAVNLHNYFVDIDGHFVASDGEDVLFFSAGVESGDDVAAVAIRDAVLVIRPLSPGVATVWVSARYRGFVWRQSFELVVTDQCPAFLCRSTASAWRWALPVGQGEAEVGAVGGVGAAVARSQAESDP